MVLSVAIATFAALAATSHGFPVQHVSLNDGGIWVTDNAVGSVGRFNKPIAQLDAVMNATSASPDLDVVQNGGLVAVWDKGAQRLYAVDVFNQSFAANATVSASSIALGGSTLAVLGADHTLRITNLEAQGQSIAGVGATAKPRAAHLPANSAVAVAADNSVYVAGGHSLRLFPAVGGAATTSAVPLPSADQWQVTTVGDTPVVADPAARKLYLPGIGRTVSLPSGDTSTDLKLQQSSPAGDVVVAATSQALYRVDLATGALTTLSSGHSGVVAAPVQVAGCVYAAWGNGAAGSYVRRCGGLAPTSSTEQSFALGSSSPSLVFRVNHGEVVLNDTTDGGVFLVDSHVTNAQPNWQQSTQLRKHHKHHKLNIQQASAPLIAKPYIQGVRPGRTTVVHVLDNDSGPPGDLLAVTRVGAPDRRGVSVAIAPDAQSVLVTLTSGVSGNAHFEYTIDDGQGHTAQAQVTLVLRSAGQNKPPNLRPHYHAPTLTVASGGSIAIPVVGDWRDFDGDPVFVDSTHISASAGSVSVGSDGAIDYTAPQTTSGLTATIRYGVSDGIAPTPTPARLAVRVLAASSTDLVPPQAEPDVVQAIVGAPLTVHPLANDLPGADPTNPQAHLTIAAPVAAVAGIAVTTDISTGTVTVTAQRPGSFLLSYDAAFGAARTSKTTIRVQASPATGAPQPPVAVPDSAVIHGQQPAVVDVLANDYDPQGWVLGIVGATSTNPSIHVSVVAQRWLRIVSDNPQPGLSATVTYTVSDGRASAIGTVSVTAVPADPSADQITARDDYIVIRAGGSAVVPVLANDSSSTGLPLSLAGNPPTANPAIRGLLASDQGTGVRVVAPASVRSEQETTVSYVATDAAGSAATGQLHVTITPAPSAAHPNQAPSPQNVDTRETAGNILVIHIPTYGIDPDGDSTAVTAVTSPPSEGRIVSIGPDTIAYQSYPGASGTDSFTYQVTDPYGATGTAQVRVGILPPGPPQPPTAVDDVVNAPPGAALHINVLANDFVAPGDNATVAPLAQTNRVVPAGVKLIGSFVYLRAPARASDAPLEFAYGVTDGSAAPSLAHVIVRAVAGAKLPPIANDDIAPAPRSGAKTVTVDVLRNDDDPLGSRSDLRITSVPAGVSVHGASLTLPVRRWPYQVPYQITAPDGLTATAVVDVPGNASAPITLKHGARIVLKRGGSATVPLASVLHDATGRKLQITTVDQLTASPAGQVSVSTHRSSDFVVHAVGGYTGPGAVTVQVYDGTSLQDPHGHTATVTIPVQVGPDVPVLVCPQSGLPVVAGGNPQTYDVSVLCNVWVDTTVGAPAPRYNVAWAKPVSGVSAAMVNGTGLRLIASPAARPGAAGRLRLTPAGASAGGEIPVTVIPAPLPTGHPVDLAGVVAGHRVTADLSQYVTSPLLQPRIQVVSVTHPAGATVTSSGSVIAVTPAANAHGVITITATVTDAPGKPARRIDVAVTVNVVGKPGQPGQPSASTSSHTIVVSFSPAASNGAPIDHYTVFTNGAPHLCAASPCTVTGLKNNVSYNVYVVAHNSVGDGPASAHVKAMPNQVPNQVLGLKTSPGDTQIGLSWQPAIVDGSPVQSYLAEISPAPGSGPSIRKLGASTYSTTFTGLANGTTYSFRVAAVNSLGMGPWSSAVTDSSFGKPLTMAAPTATSAAVPNPSTTRAITASWPAANDNGRPISGYTVREYRSSSSGGPWAVVNTLSVPAGTHQQSFTVAANGSWYEYTISAANVAGSSPESPQSSPALQGSAPPYAPPGTVKALASPSGSNVGYNGAIHVKFTVPQPNSTSLTSVQYGINAAAVSGSWSSPPAPGQPADESIAGLTNGASYVVYVRGCNDANLCGPWSAPSNQVIPYGPLGTPGVSAQASGTSIIYNWNPAANNGLTDTLHVCFDGGSCFTTTTAGSTTTPYGYTQTHTITAYTTDTAGEQTPTASASATTVTPPPPTVSVAIGNPETPTVGSCGSACYNALVTVNNFAPNAVVNYACYDNGSQYWPYSGTIDVDWNGNVVRTNAGGYAQFNTQCVWGYWSSTVTLKITANGVSGSYTG